MGDMPRAKRDLAFWLEHSGTGPWEPEHKFHPVRRWRFDWANLETKVAIEYDGIMGGHASHSSMGGILRDSEKGNEAALLGWLVLRVNAKSVESGDAYRWIEGAVALRTGVKDSGAH